MPHCDLGMVTGGMFSYDGRYVARRWLDEGVGVRTLTRDPGRENHFGGTVRGGCPGLLRPGGACPVNGGNERPLHHLMDSVRQGRNTCAQAVENSQTLFEAAAQAGVGRVVHNLSAALAQFLSAIDTVHSSRQCWRRSFADIDSPPSCSHTQSSFFAHGTFFLEEQKYV